MMQFVDPHFHLWNITDSSIGSHNFDTLGGQNNPRPIYYFPDYLQDISRCGVELQQCVHVETIPDDHLKETRWLRSVADAHPQKMTGFVCRADLSDAAAKEELLAQGQVPGVVGVRQILNHHPLNPSLTWPKVHRSDYFDDPVFLGNLAVMQELGLSFDLQCNPHQNIHYASLFQKYQGIPVIINHLGCLHLSEATDIDDEANLLRTWTEGMTALALLPNAFVKISRLEFIKGYEWLTNKESREKVVSLVHQMIALFGPSRCMFASNLPDTHPDHIVATFDAFREMASIYSAEEQEELFVKSAMRAYRLQKYSS